MCTFLLWHLIPGNFEGIVCHDAMQQWNNRLQQFITTHILCSRKNNQVKQINIHLFTLSTLHPIIIYFSCDPHVPKSSLLIEKRQLKQHPTKIDWRFNQGRVWYDRVDPWRVGRWWCTNLETVLQRGIVGIWNIW